MTELIKVDTQAQLINEDGADLEAARRLRVILMPQPYLHSADSVPDKMRYVVGAEPPLSQEEIEQIKTKVEQHEELKDILTVNPIEPMADMGTGFIADHLGMQRKHFERGAMLAGIATEVVGVEVARIIFNELVPNEELELFHPDDFGDNSDYHLEPRHYAYLP